MIVDGSFVRRDVYLTPVTWRPPAEVDVSPKTPQFIVLMLVILLSAACGRTDLFDRTSLEADGGSGIDDMDTTDMNADGGDEPDASDADAGFNDMDPDMGSCTNGVRDRDEDGVDCGGEFCEPCPCDFDDDCSPDSYCDDGVCLPKKPTGEDCERAGECRGELCEFFDEFICTETCESTCPAGFSCFRDLCVPDDYCDQSLSLPAGPGCPGTICDRCDSNATCVQQPEDGQDFCACNTGWRGDGLTCADIDECAENSDICPDNSNCQNTPGGYQCVCQRGYEIDPATGTCIDVNECSRGTDDCDPNAVCTNDQGGWICTCSAGWEGPGDLCFDIDECANDPCDPNVVCINEPGGFSCGCPSGTVEVNGECRFQGDVCGGGFQVNSLPLFSNSDTSSKSNDYSAPAGACPGILVGSRGGSSPDEVWEFTPTQSGTYTIDVDDQGFIAAAYVVTDCADIANTCIAGDTFTPSLSIDMTAGTTYYIIVDGGSNFSTQTGPYGIEIQFDECASGLSNCDANATCNDTPVGFFCSCNAGYTGTGETCTDLDECATNTDDCDMNATCANTDGGFDCTCNAGFSGDGVTCWDPSALGESCLAPFALGAVPVTVTGNTSDANNDHSVSNGDCPGIFNGGGASNDEVYEFVPTVTRPYTVTLQANFGTAMWITTDCTNLQSACIEGDSGLGGFNNAELTPTLTAGTRYFIVVDGLSNAVDRSGPYTLRIR